MFNLGFMEIIVVGVLALIFIGPKQMPEMARVLGRMINEFKKATSELSGGLLDIKKDLREPFEESLNAFTKMQNDLHNEVKTTVESVKSSIHHHDIPAPEVKSSPNPEHFAAEVDHHTKKTDSDGSES